MVVLPALSGIRLPDRGLLMRTFVRAFVVSIGFAVAVSAAQKPEDGPLSASRKGDTIVVQRLCVRAAAEGSSSPEK